MWESRADSLHRLVALPRWLLLVLVLVVGFGEGGEMTAGALAAALGVPRGEEDDTLGWHSTARFALDCISEASRVTSAACRGSASAAVCAVPGGAVVLNHVRGAIR